MGALQVIFAIAYNIFEITKVPNCIWRQQHSCWHSCLRNIRLFPYDVYYYYYEAFTYCVIKNEFYK